MVYSMNSIDQYLRNPDDATFPTWIFPDYWYGIEFEFGRKHDNTPYKVNLVMDSMVNRGDNDKYSACKDVKKTESPIADRINYSKPN